VGTLSSTEAPPEADGDARAVSGDDTELSTSFHYILDMVRDPDQHGHVVDQMLVHAKIFTGKLFLHCSRAVWRVHGADEADVSNISCDSIEGVPFEDVIQTYTSCTLVGDDLLTLSVEEFEGELQLEGLRNVQRLCAVMQDFFCKGSSRVAAPSSDAPSGGYRRNDAEMPASEGCHASTQSGQFFEGGSDRARVGQSDLDPIDRRGGGHGIGSDGMMVGPHHPIFGRGRLEPPPGHEGHLPSGARWDPIGPPGLPGFFPGDFNRQIPRNDRGSGSQPPVHPDIMQPGPSRSSSGLENYPGAGFHSM
jgi:hypothetical protein